MNTEIKAVHFSLDNKTKELLEKKVEKIHNAESMIIDLLFTMTKNKDFSAEVLVNFRWGVSAHLKEKDFDLNVAIDKLMDKLDAKITKEKDKIKEKR